MNRFLMAALAAAFVSTAATADQRGVQAGLNVMGVGLGWNSASTGNKGFGLAPRLGDLFPQSASADSHVAMDAIEGSPTVSAGMARGNSSALLAPMFGVGISWSF